MKGYRLQIKRLDFISAVDAGAQGPISNVALIKRTPTGDKFTLTCIVDKDAKLDESLGVVFGYAIASTVDGGKSPHIDLQGDAVVGGDELIKVALGFAEAGAQSDVMHDCIKDGWVPFVMPLNAETKKAFKLAGDVEGIAIGMKPSQETFKRFQSGELAAFSIYGEGVRTPLPEQKRAPVDKIQKASLYTDLVDGHQHKVCVYDDGSLYVEWATMEGADQGHSHGIVFENGALTILADSGHTHELAEGQPGIVAVPADAIVVIAASAAKSTRSDRVQQDEPTLEEPMTTPADKQTFDLTKQLETANGKVTDLTAKLEVATKLASLSDAQRAFYKSLGAGDAADFLAKSYADRELDVAVEYTAKDGTVYRKHEDRRLVEMAKRQDQMTADLAKRDEEIEKQEIAAIAKSTLGSVAGEDDVHQYIVKSIKKGGGNAAMIDKALTALKGANAAAKSASFAKGYNPGTEPVANSAEAALEAIAQKIATEQKVDITKARDLALDTPEGAAVYTEMRKRKAMNQASA